MNLNEKKTVALVSPVIGEFGWTLFEVQDKVRHFFKNTNCERKIVIADPSLKFLFEEATDVIPLPAEMKIDLYPQCLGKQHDPFEYYSRLVEWTKKTYEPTEMLEIPYHMQSFQRWTGASEYKMFTSEKRSWEPHICMSARNVKERGASKNMDKTKWDVLVSLVKQEWDLPIYSIGLDEDTYVPDGVLKIECDKNDYIETAVSCLNSAKFFFSSNSGTTHLSLLSGCPTFTWGDSASLTKRMEVDTNPFNVPCKCLSCGWHPASHSIWTDLREWASTFVSEKV